VVGEKLNNKPKPWIYQSSVCPRFFCI
jgi:hypothetical protein